jgi:hypothetical protein
MGYVYTIMAPTGAQAKINVTVIKRDKWMPREFWHVIIYEPQEGDSNPLSQNYSNWKQ